jgi:hypothetical protein
VWPRLPPQNKLSGVTYDQIDEAIAQLLRALEGDEPRPMPQDGPRTQVALSLLRWFCYATAGGILVLYTVKLIVP